VKIYCKTDTGKTRDVNQDAYLAHILDDDTAFAVVCDGMGGAKAGNIASTLAAKTIYDYVLRSWQSDMNDTQIKNLLCSAVMSANVEVYDAAQRDEELNGMGTTVVVTIMNNDFAYIVHVGDSRAYLLRDDLLSQITIDHSMVQKMIESGELTAEEARLHPKKNVITRALGVDENVNIDYNELSCNKDDIILICTDGLSNMLENHEIVNIILNKKLENAAEALVSEANEKGGIDNITAVLISNIK